MKLTIFSNSFEQIDENVADLKKIEQIVIKNTYRSCCHSIKVKQQKKKPHKHLLKMIENKVYVK